jgi:2-polyprenyl-3-methyl-5-hydroxy-6-metoxy-1,4-benzoquinol methylase
MAVRERIYLTRKELEEREMAILNDRHIERYGMIRQWCYGRVVDFGCGCGYGSWMVSRNPDVASTIGYDRDGAALEYARFHYTSMRDPSAPTFTDIVPDACDTLVALEIMEHIEDEMYIAHIAKQIGAKTVIASYPSKKTTHYNIHHFHDFSRDDMVRIWERSGYPFRIVEFIELYREHMIVRIERV